jgi:hypothetical protein
MVATAPRILTPISAELVTPVRHDASHAQRREPTGHRDLGSRQDVRRLQAFVEVNPISHLVTGVRSMMAGAWDMGEIMWTLIASAVLVAVFGTLTMRLYNRR